ncbi:MAG: hypothetical protein KAT38_00505, partial [Bacteroidales bacterium]|nr:hypothetical protein [Bacteroidales bacterium]
FTPNGTELFLGQPGITDIRQNTHTIITISEEILNQEGMVGNWTLEISDSNMSKATEHYQYTVINTSKNLKLNTWFDKNVYYTGDVMKIYLELLSKDGRLTDMDNIYIKGTKPGEGLGSWLVSKKVTPKLMGKIRHEQLDELMKWKMAQPQFKKLSSAEKEPFLKAQRKSFIEKLDPVYLRSQVLMKKYKRKYPRRVVINGLTFNDEGADGDKIAEDGLFTTMHSPLTTEGSYKFFISVIDSSKGKNIQRESQLQTYVNVKYELDGVIRFATIADTVIKGKKVYNVPLKLKDKFGNIPGPLALIHMHLQVDKGELIGDIQANPFGTFTQMVSIPENIKLKGVTITMIVDDRIGEQKLKSPVPRWIYKIFYRCYLKHFENFYKKEKIE